MVSLNKCDSEICRICLELGAAFPIFEKPGDTEDSLNSKLFTSTNLKIEDVEGLPRYICSKCKTTVDILCDFVQKIKESNKSLQYGLQNIKQEKDDHYSEHEVFFDIDNDYIDEEEIKLEEPLIKIETNLIRNENEKSIDDQLQALFKSSELNVKKIKTEPQQNKKGKKNRPKFKAKNKTNNIATSILEGSFEWTGRKWCISSTTIKKLSKTAIRKKSQDSKEIKKREASIKIPKVKVETPSNRSKLCDICGKTLQRTVSIRDHMKSHEIPVTVKCKECNKEFNSNAFLNRHMKSMHMERKYVCNECGRTFSLPNHLSAHTKKVHQKHLYPQKFYQCSFCNKSYKAKQSVDIHERSVHTGIRPAECTFCEARFFHEVYLAEHMRLHTGETPYKCPVCGRGYAQRGNMKSHILHNHRISQLTSEQLSQIKPCYLKVMKE